MDHRRAHVSDALIRADPRAAPAAAATEFLGASTCGEEVDVVFREEAIRSDELQPLGGGLSDQHPVERVVVMPRQGRRSGRVLEGDGEPCEPRSLDTFPEALGKAHLPEGLLDRDLPRGGDADEYRVCAADGLPNRRGDPLSVGAPPQDDVRVEEQISMRGLLEEGSIMSLGKGASKSLATHTLPFQPPDLRFSAYLLRERDEPGYNVLGDDDLLSARRAVDELGQVRLGFVEVEVATVKLDLFEAPSSSEAPAVGVADGARPRVDGPRPMACPRAAACRAPA